MAFFVYLLTCCKNKKRIFICIYMNFFSKKALISSFHSNVLRVISSSFHSYVCFGIALRRKSIYPLFSPYQVVFFLRMLPSTRLRNFFFHSNVWVLPCFHFIPFSWFFFFIFRFDNSVGRKNFNDNWSDGNDEENFISIWISHREKNCVCESISSGNVKKEKKSTQAKKCIFYIKKAACWFVMDGISNKIAKRAIMHWN